MVSPTGPPRVDIPVRQRHFPQPPAGHLTSEEAACLIGCCAQTVQKMMHDGRLAGVTAELVGIRYGKVAHRSFPLAASVEAFCLARSAQATSRASGEAAKALLIPKRPLISPDDRVALGARWALWEKAGRVWPELYSGAKSGADENCLDVKPKAG